MIESIVNVLVGVWVAVLAQYFLFPLFGIPVTLQTSFLIAIPMTVISILRSYMLRRFFNWLHTRVQ